MGIRKTIYLQDEEIWESIKQDADKARRSISNYLIGLYLSKDKEAPKVFKQDVAEIKKMKIPNPISQKKEEPSDMTIEERREWAYKQMRKKDGRG